MFSGESRKFMGAQPFDSLVFGFDCSVDNPLATNPFRSHCLEQGCGPLHQLNIVYSCRTSHLFLFLVNLKKYFIELNIDDCFLNFKLIRTMLTIKLFNLPI